MRNYEGYITTYEEPIKYEPHDPKTCHYCQNKRQELHQGGITSLLDGENMFIKPEGFDELHNRGGGQHRLRANPSKWLPRGIGEEED